VMTVLVASDNQRMRSQAGLHHLQGDPVLALDGPRRGLEGVGRAIVAARPAGPPPLNLVRSFAVVPSRKASIWAVTRHGHHRPARPGPEPARHRSSPSAAPPPPPRIFQTAIEQNHQNSLQNTDSNHPMNTITSQHLLGQLNWRYATKQFDPQRKISPADWAALEEALVLTPSSFGLQPWKFVVVTDPARREKLVAASWGLVAAAPLLGVCALWIRKASPGSPFYTQEREGRDGTTLHILKLRTMFSNAVIYAIHYQCSIPAITLLAGAFIGKGVAFCKNIETKETKLGVLNFCIALLIALLVLVSVWSIDSRIYVYQAHTRWTGLWKNPNIFGLLMGTGLVLAVGLVLAAALYERCHYSNHKKN